MSHGLEEIVKNHLAMGRTLADFVVEWIEIQYAVVWASLQACIFYMTNVNGYNSFFAR
jgi:hypothetical protein